MYLYLFAVTQLHHHIVLIKCYFVCSGILFTCLLIRDCTIISCNIYYWYVFVYYSPVGFWKHAPCWLLEACTMLAFGTIHLLAFGSMQACTIMLSLSSCLPFTCLLLFTHHLIVYCYQYAVVYYSLVFYWTPAPWYTMIIICSCLPFTCFLFCAHHLVV